VIGIEAILNENGHLVETLTNSQMFQEYERSYTEATGLPVTLRQVETWQVPLHGKCKENPWCAMMADKSRTCLKQRGLTLDVPVAFGLAAISPSAARKLSGNQGSKNFVPVLLLSRCCSAHHNGNSAPPQQLP
jgi:hypothetical protein